MNVRKLAVLLVAALALVAAGCGGSSNEASGDTTTAETTTAETTTEATTTAETTTEQTSTDSSGVDTTALSGQCAQLAGLGSKLAAAVGGQDASVADTSKLFDEMADQVPDEIKVDWQVLAQNFKKIAVAVKGADLSSGTPDAATLAKLQRLATTLDSREVRQAAAHIEAWAKKNC